MVASKYLTLINLLRNERRSADELIHHQTIKLKELVNHAYSTVPFYKKNFDDCGLHPSDIGSIEDIRKIPVIDKDLLKQNSYNNLISKKYKIEDLFPVKTAGSNGTPYLFYVDPSFDMFRKAQFLRPYLTNGKRLLDTTVSFSVNKSAKKKWFQKLGFMPETKIFSGADISSQLNTIQKQKPDIIQGYGSVLNLLAFKILNENIPISKPRLIFTDSELLMPDMRENIEKAFSSKVIDIYGTFETDNIAYECHHHNGYHIALDSVIMELINDNNPVKPGEEGEIVVTVLNNYAMPFIRYNLHDVGSLINTPCTCGRTFPLMSQLKGRTSDYLFTEDGKKLSIFSLGRFASLAPNVCEYQIIQESLNLFTLLIVPNKSYNNEGEKFIAAAIKEFFPNAEINIHLITSIPREPSGKFKAFKSKVHISGQNI